MDFGDTLHCQNCGTLNRPQSNMTGVPACASCGLTSVEGAFAMQDELSKLFQRGMTFSQPDLPSVAQHQQQQTPSPEVRPTLGYSASQHYTPVTRPILSPEPEPEAQTDNLPLAVEQLLLQHGIFPDSLQAGQKSLFLYATPDQRARLLELWATYKQSQGADLPMGTLVDNNGSEMMKHENVEFAEPYIRDGYDNTDYNDTNRNTFSPFGSAVGNKQEYRQSVDPAYHSGSQEWWRHNSDGIAQPMEHQYGMFEAMRQYHIPIDDDEML